MISGPASTFVAVLPTSYGGRLSGALDVTSTDETEKGVHGAVDVTAISAPDGQLLFSAASLWEITIKHALGRADFSIEPRIFRQGLLDNGYVELPITSEHAVSVESLPDLHHDPVDRLLIAQAICEGITLVTSDSLVAQYPGPIRLV